MVQGSQVLVYKSDCDKNMGGLKCDLKELILQERDDRKEGENELKTEITKGIGEVQGELKGMKNAILGLAGSILVAIIVAIIEFVFGRL